VVGIRAANIASYDGWAAWPVTRLGGERLHDLRLLYIESSEVAVPSKTDWLRPGTRDCRCAAYEWS
jgi:hypothetical protein